MAATRVLVVDDSVVVRRSLAEAFSCEPDVVAAGSAASGRIALMKIPLLQPDVVLFDINMPGTDVVETLLAIRGGYPDLPVIILNTLRDVGTAAAIDALALGSIDYVVKPDGATPREGLRLLARELVPMIVAMAD